MPRSLLGALVGLVLMVVGAVGPWASVLGILTINGTDDGKDGWIVIAAGALVAVFLVPFAITRRRWLLLPPVLAAAAGAVTAGYDISDIKSLAPSEGGRAIDTEWGIYVALAGSIVVAVACVVAFFEARRLTAPATGS
jgi:hypothetical protein